MIINTNSEAFRKYSKEGEFDKIRRYQTVAEMWAHSAKEYADREAIFYAGVSYSYSQLDADVSLFRTVLKEAGVKRGDRVGMLIPNSYTFAKVFLAIQTLGATAAVLPVHLDQTQVFGCGLKFALTALVYDDSQKDKTGLTAQRNAKLALIQAQTQAIAPSPAAEVKKEDGCAILFTGGTTGKSKGALLSNGAYMKGVENGCYGYEGTFGQRYILVLPLSHVFGLVRNLGTSLQTGSSLCICVNSKDMFKDIAVYKPTILVAVPALVELALNLSKQFNKSMFGPALKYIICGAATVAPYLAAECKKYGVTLCAGYGLTESANLVSGNPETNKKPTSVGIPYGGQQLRVENGELWIKGENMMDGYVGDEQENAAAYEDGWFKTGDLVRFDEEGYLYIIGRIKEIIILPNGENISPAEVECKFNALDIVQDTQIFEDVNEAGVPILAMEVYPRMVELAKVPAEDKNGYLLEELQKINAALPSMQRVSKIVIRDTDFARTPAMKIVRYKKV